MTKERVVDTRHLAEYLDVPQQELEAALSDPSKAKTEVNVVVTGKTGSGRTLLIQALCGEVNEQNEPDHDLFHETREMRATCARREYTITMKETPGVEDERVQQAMRQCRGEIDILLYCIDCSLTRCVLGEMVPGMKVVTQTLGPDIWRHAMIVLTFANELEKKEYDGDTKSTFTEHVDQWQHKVQEALRKAGVTGSIAREVPVALAGHYMNPSFPGISNWLGELWYQSLVRMKKEAHLSFIVNSHERLRDPKFVRPEEIVDLLRRGVIPIVVEQSRLRRVLIWLGFLGSATASTVAGAALGGVAGKLLVGGAIAAKVGVAAGVGIGLGAGALGGITLFGVSYGLWSWYRSRGRKEKKE